MSLNKYLLLGLLFSLNIKATEAEILFEDTLVELARIKFYSTIELQKYGLSFDEEGFHLQTDGELIDIPTYLVDVDLRNKTPYQMEQYLEKGYLTLKQVDEREFVIHGNVKGLGGGPLTGAVLSWITRAVGYGAPIAVGGAAIVAAAPTVAAGGTAKAIICGTASKALGGGAGIASGVIGSNPAALGVAAKATTVLVSTGANYVAVVETASATAFGIGCAIPFLP